MNHASRRTASRPGPRIIAGRARGRPITVPRGLATRPTAARAREALFSALGDRVAGARVADLFAGAGALGLEAWSRGAAHVVFFEASSPARRAIEANVRALGAQGDCALVGGALPGSLKAADPWSPWDLVLMDPPWGQGLAPPVLERLVAQGRLAPGALVIVEERAGAPSDALAQGVAGLSAHTQRRYGDAVFTWLRSGDEAAGPSGRDSA